MQKNRPPVYHRIRQILDQCNLGSTLSYRVAVDAIAKGDTKEHPFCVANEMICAKIAQFLGLPVPACGIVQEEFGRNWFASLDFNLQGDDLPDIDPVEFWCVDPETATGVVVFDILVCNGDRHTGNLSLDQSVSPLAIRVFDHSHALLGTDARAFKKRCDELRDRLGITGGTVSGPNRHCLLDVIKNDYHFSEWTARVKSIPDFFIENLCSDAETIGISSECATACSELLLYRISNIDAIIRCNADEFTGMTQEELFSWMRPAT